MEIKTLIPDIYQLLKRKDGWFTPELSAYLGRDIAERLRVHLGEEYGPSKLRLSKMGPTCPCALWYSIHHPELAEPMPPWAEIKFSFGHILEALAITLAKAAGHEITGEQDELVLDGVTGHRDCVIDGCVVDVKSSASRSFAKFRDGSIKESDSFGYLDQLDGYVVASADDPLVRVKDRGYILAIDKQLGHMVIYEHRIREHSIRERIKHSREIVGRPTPPACECGIVSDGKSGNFKLDVKASYNAFKHSCFPNLRTFLYASGPVYLTKVVRRPDVTEIDKFGKVVYN